jgi:hypothetical protein
VATKPCQGTGFAPEKLADALAGRDDDGARPIDQICLRIPYLRRSIRRLPVRKFKGRPKNAAGWH